MVGHGQSVFEELIHVPMIFAGPKIAKKLVKKGGTLVDTAEGFFVAGGEGYEQPGGEVVVGCLVGLDHGVDDVLAGHFERMVVAQRAFAGTDVADRLEPVAAEDEMAGDGMAEDAANDEG